MEISRLWSNIIESFKYALYIYIYINLHHRIFHTVIIKSFWQQYWDCELTFLSQLFFDNGVLKLRWETYNHLRIQSKPYDFRPKICVICLPFCPTHMYCSICVWIQWMTCVESAPRLIGFKSASQTWLSMWN